MGMSRGRIHLDSPVVLRGAGPGWQGGNEGENWKMKMKGKVIEDDTSIGDKKIVKVDDIPLKPLEAAETA